MNRFLIHLRSHTGQWIALIAATLMLVAFFGLQPWAAVRLPTAATSTASTGAQAPAGRIAIPTADANGMITVPDGIQLPPFLPTPNADGQIPASSLPNLAGGNAAAAGAPPGAQAPTSGTTQVPTRPGGRLLGGIPPVMLTIFTNPMALLVPLAAIVALLVTLISFRKLGFNPAARLITLVVGLLALVYFVTQILNGGLPTAPGFWLALIGAVGLVGQIALPRPRPADYRPPFKVEGLPAGKGSALNLGMNLSIAFDALMANKLRSGLTMLGVIIGVMSVVALLSVGQGAQVSITDQISGTGLNVLTINPGRGGFGGGNAQTLTLEDADALERQLRGVDAILPQYNQTFRLTSEFDDVLTTVRGVGAAYAEKVRLELGDGRFFSESEYDSRARVAVIGNNTAEDLFGGIDPLGRTIRIDGTRFEVIGVLAEQEQSTPGANPNNDVYIPLSTGYRVLFQATARGSGVDLVSNIRVSVVDLEDVDDVKAQVESILREEHNLKEGDDNDFSILDQQSLLDTASTITGILTVLLGAIASISLVVGGIGIMNISLVSVTERTREIGLRKALGARRSSILRQFLIETIFLSVLGGVIGVLLGVGIALGVSASGLLETSITWDSIVLGLGFSIVVGVFFGVYPATRAASLQPIEALRYE
ncbi:MAG: ABC transporter permease [Anaerolineae bacterium]|nr:ABC transporter permease [Anaerolineae bacterium]